MGPIRPATSSGNEYILLFTDVFTRFPIAVPTARCDKETVARVFRDKVICEYGAPAQLLSDNGKAFISRLVRLLCDQFGIEKTFSVPYRPQTMGLVERMNQSLMAMLRTHTADSGEEWDKSLPSVIFAYRAAVHAALGDSPFHLVYGRDAVLPVDLLLHNGQEPVDEDDRYIWRMARDFQQSWELARKNLESAQETLKTNFDRKADADRVRVADVMLKRIHLHQTGEIRKLAPGLRRVIGLWKLTNPMC